MSANNPQDKYFRKSKYFSIAQDLLGVVGFILAIFQGITLAMSAKMFLTVAGMVLIAEYLALIFKNLNFNKGHYIRETGLLDNSFNEKKIPNYNSEEYYNNGVISEPYIKLLANIHENAMFTSEITSKMTISYIVFSVIAFIFVLIKLFMDGMDDYSSILLSFIVSSSFFNRAMQLNSLKKETEDIYEKANDICNSYEKNPIDKNILLPRILELFLKYESVIFESKIIIKEKIFKKYNDSLTLEWKKIRDGYLIYRQSQEIEE